MWGILMPALFFLSMLHVVTGFSWPALPPSDLTLTAENDYTLFYVGENLTLHCNKTNPFDGKILFKRANEVVNDTFVRVVSNTYAVMEKPVTSDDFPQTKYRCKDNLSLSSEKTIYTEYYPQNATHFSMIYLDKVTLQMSWTNGEDNITYKNIHITQPRLKVVNITAEYRKLPNGPWTLCEGSIISTSCNVSSFTQSDARVSLRVNVTNTKRNHFTSTVLPPLRVTEHVKPRPVTVVGCSPQSSQSVACDVTHTWPGLKYRVTACAYGGPSTACIQREIPMTSSKTLNVTGLHPNYSYKLTLEAAFDKGFYSEPSNPSDFKMPKDVPGAAPSMTNGSFYVDLSRCSEPSPMAAFYVYFQEVPEEEQNGEILSYTGEVIKGGDRFNMERPVTVDDSSWARTLDTSAAVCGLGFTLSLVARNPVGLSPTARYPIPSLDQKLHKRVEEALDLRLKVGSDGGVTAEWNHQPSALKGLAALYLYFCTPDPSDPKRCRDAIRHHKVDNPQSGSVVVGGNAGMMYGLAAMTPGGSTTGIMWSSCFYDPTKRLVNVVTMDQVTAVINGLLVLWKGLERCNPENRIIILNYEVRLCDAKEQDSECKELSVPARNKSVTVTGLNPWMDYTVSVRANTTSGLSNFSLPLVGSPQPDSSSRLTTAEKVGISIGVLLLCVVLGTLVFCFCSGVMRQRLPSVLALQPYPSAKTSYTTTAPTVNKTEIGTP